MREKQRREEAEAIKASREARLGSKRPLAPHDPSEIPLDAAELKKVKKGKPVQTKAWSQKEEADAKKEARRLKKVKKAKAVHGKLIESRGEDGEEQEEDWKEQVREEREKRKREKLGGNSGLVMEGLEV